MTGALHDLEREVGPDLLHEVHQTPQALGRIESIVAAVDDKQAPGVEVRHEQGAVGAVVRVREHERAAGEGQERRPRVGLRKAKNQAPVPPSETPIRQTRFSSTL
ncbi:MAG: hypothetical protein LJF30_16010 [Acidobacteria bacterium]|nr:hypothetical protein [Acidobacteriota bacterium]